MLPRENQSYDRHLVTKENQLFEFQCGHTVTTSITTMIDFNNSDELGRWNTNNAKGNCPRCGQIEGFKLLQEKIITEKNDCYDEMEWYHQILVDHSLNIIFYRTYELCKSIDNKEYPRIHKEVVELLETIKKYENELENMDSTFEFYRNNYAMNQSFNIMNEHVSRAGLYLTNLHFKLTDILRSIYENPSQFSDVERNFIYYKANLVLATIEAEYKQRDAYKELQKELSGKIMNFIQNNIGKTN